MTSSLKQSNRFYLFPTKQSNKLASNGYVVDVTMQTENQEENYRNRVRYFSLTADVSYFKLNTESKLETKLTHGS